MEHVERQSYANCIARAHDARMQATTVSDEELRKHYTQIAEMWEHMATSIKKNGLDIADGKGT